MGDSLDYQDLQFAKPRSTDGLNPDGMLRAEVRAHGLVNGSGIGCGFGKDPGDWVRYCINVDHPFKQAALIFRYRLEGQASTLLRLEGALQAEVALEVDRSGDGQDAFGFVQTVLPIGCLATGVFTFT